jgi:hypothetical protein
MPEPLPGQNRGDVRQPEDYPLEEFRPGTPRMNDQYDEDIIFQRRQVDEPGPAEFTPEAPMDSAPVSGKGDLMDVQSSVGTDAMNPSGGADGAPVPLYPGQ